MIECHLYCTNTLWVNLHRNKLLGIYGLCCCTQGRQMAELASTAFELMYCDTRYALAQGFY